MNQHFCIWYLYRYYHMHHCNALQPSVVCMWLPCDMHVICTIKSPFYLNYSYRLFPLNSHAIQLSVVHMWCTCDNTVISYCHVGPYHYFCLDYWNRLPTTSQQCPMIQTSLQNLTQREDLGDRLHHPWRHMATVIFWQICYPALNMKSKWLPGMRQVKGHLQPT